MFEFSGDTIITSRTVHSECNSIAAPYFLNFGDFIRIYITAAINNCSNVYFFDLSKDGTCTFSVKPVLSLGGKGCFDEEGITSVSIIKDIDGYNCYYTGIISCESVPYDKAIGVAKSASEGKYFSRLGNGPVVSYSRYEPFVVAYPRVIKNGNLWVMAYTAGVNWATNSDNLCSKLHIATSVDGVNWNKMNKEVLISDGENQLHPDLFMCNNKYYMLFNYAQEGSDNLQLGCAWSTDLNNWHREEINFQDKQNNNVLYPHTVIINNQFYLLYIVNNEEESCLKISEITIP